MSTPAAKIPFSRKVHVVPNALSPSLGIDLTPILNGVLNMEPTAFPVLGEELNSVSDGFTSEKTVLTLGALGGYVL